MPQRVTCREGGRTLSGRVDAFVETPDVIIVVDHKSFPGARAQWLDQAKMHAGQLLLYGEAITAAMPPLSKSTLLCICRYRGML